MRAKTTTFLIGFFGMGLFYGILLTFLDPESSTLKVVKGAVFFGIMWGLAEVFVFPWIRKRFKQKEE